MYKRHLFVLAILPLFASCGGNNQSNMIDVASYVDTTGKTPCSDKIQQLIIDNPHHTLYFRDGVYLLDKQIKTPGDPSKSVDLKLSNYAILRAADNYQAKRPDGERKRWEDDYLYMVSLGGLDRTEETRIDVTITGSVYGLTGGIIECQPDQHIGGIEIASGRETRVQNVSMKGVEVGLKIAYGINSSSSDSDVSDVDIICNETKDSLGLWVDGNDNTVTNMRVGHTRHGVLLTGGGNILRNIHPLLNGDNAFEDYASSYGFYVRSQNVLNYCYADNFATAFKIAGAPDIKDLEKKSAARAIFSDCFTWWYNSHENSYQMIENYGNFNSVFTNLSCGFGADPGDGHYTSILKITDGGSQTHEENPDEPGSHGLVENIFICNRDYLGDIENDIYLKNHNLHDSKSFFRGVDADY